MNVAHMQLEIRIAKNIKTVAKAKLGTASLPQHWLGFWDPACRLCPGPPAPELPVPSPRRDMGWVWNWVMDLPKMLQNAADSDFQDPRTPENQISNISRSPKIKENLHFQYSQDSGECWRLQFPIFPRFWRMLQTS